MSEIDQLLEFKGWIVGVVFVLLFAFEHLRPAVKADSHPIQRIIKNLAFWPINIGLSLAVIFPVSFFAAHNAFWVRPDWLSGIPGVVLSILLLELFIYFWHRAVHEIPFLWRFHEVHHLDQHLDTTSAIRFHFGEIFFATFVRAFVIMVFAVPFSTIVLFETLVLGFTLFHHSNIALPTRFENALSKIFITPSIHWVHHHAIRQDTDSNYGTIFSFWDRLFRSKSETKRFKEMKIGVQKKTDTVFLKLLVKPFLG